jgi:CMD domain protein
MRLDTDEDVIDRVAGIAPGSPLDQVRRQRAEARRHAQASFEALFRPLDETAMGLRERAAVALFVAALHGDAAAADFYAGLLEQCGGAALAAPVRAAAAQAAGRGPHGRYPAGPLSREDVPEALLAVQDAALGPRLSAALGHARMLVFHPRDAAPAHLEALVQAHWSSPGIVTLSQLVAFLSFQIRAVAGFRAMQAA